MMEPGYEFQRLIRWKMYSTTCTLQITTVVNRSIMCQLQKKLWSILCIGKGDHSELILVMRKREHHGII